ncbi:piRNA biogenesis protein EXD1-like [Mizuhopecten yessoensis]|uniref:piRNA biogenesis protein EXD1-like n=1 Tax=Mizuhopecten yessoensis TaxID=6573 RepID=UPI000B45C74E|nr:piRNA biogenesis protein EXD1-like [Mizuhopecten yessoensis]XP_021372115.1 piRNA biogenesis protein EXD1-like [Mizuhopecten yessoensis]
MATPKDHTLIDDRSSLVPAFSEIKSQKLIAVDCEGVKLSRKGQLTILTVATTTKVFIFDVFKLGQSVFDGGLRDILENKSIEKLMFDCRQDSDSLWHQFKVKLTGVLDLQLLDIIYRRNHRPRRSYGSIKRCEKDEVENINGYKRCLGNYVYDSELLEKKEKGNKELKDNYRIWTVRPLTETLIDYCVVDVAAMFPMYKKLKESDDVLPRLSVASERYADIWRAMEVRSFDRFEFNAYLPLDIIPEEGSLSFPFGSTKCTKCQRMFPHDEFRNSQLRTGSQTCRVCRKVQQR